MEHIQKLRKLLLTLAMIGGLMLGMNMKTYAATTITCSTSDVGRVLCTDGSIYDTVSEASQENKTAAAMIAYIDMDKCEGLALALSDESDSKVYGADAVSLAAAHTPSVLGGTWMLASESLWNLMINAWGRETLRDGFSGVGGTNLKNDYYYSSTTSSNKYRCYDFNYGWYFRWNDEKGGYARACLKFDVTPVSVTGVTLDKTSAALTVGDTETLTATVSPDGATYKTVTWSSDNTAVATVSDGVVTAVSVGTANIIVTATNGTEDTSDDKTATCAVTVTADKSALNTAITAAETLYNSIKEVKDYSTIAGTLNAAIDAAKDVAGSDTATQNDVDAATTAITNAKKNAETAKKDVDDTTEANKVSTLIENLPAKEAITKDDTTKVEAAKAAFNELTDDQKKKVSDANKQKLNDAIAAIEKDEQPVTVAAKADPYNTGAYYATFYDSTTSYTADCEVYYATANADGRFTLEKAEGNVIKAGEGVILKATSETVTLTQTDAAASYDSLLTGSDTETTVENALVLSLGKNGVWFYKYSGTLGANKAYLAQ